MKTSQILFALSILGILILSVLNQTTTKTSEGTISQISYSTNKITIILENEDQELVIFDNKILNLKKGDKILFQGKQETYKNKKQIIVDKIFLVE